MGIWYLIHKVIFEAKQTLTLLFALAHGKASSKILMKGAIVKAGKLAGISGGDLKGKQVE